MRATEFITEVPLTHYEPIGDFSQPGKGGFRHEVDRKLATHPTNIKKIHTFLEQTPFDFRVYALNKPGASKFAEYGEMTYDVFELNFSEDIAAKVFADSDDAITIVYVGNSGAERVMFTPWIMAHRFGHAIQAGGRTSRAQNYAWKEAEQHFFRSINGILEEYYNKPSAERFGVTPQNMKYDLTREYNALFNTIGTMRSARTNQIKRPYEFFYECFAQYLKTGEVTFNPLPRYIDYGRKAWGRSTNTMRGKNTDQGNEELQILANDLTYLFNDVLSNAQGNVYVM
jgi:hypothetical protein